MLKEHEKFWAFMALGFGVMALAGAAYVYPPEDGSGAQRIIDAAMGGLLLALGGATNALFRIRDPGENRMTIENKPSDPVPVEETPSKS